MQLNSTAFKNGERLPTRYSCDGEDVSPPLEWSGAPDETASFAIFCDDRDAPTGAFNHWAVFNIPRTAREVPEGFASHVPSTLILQGKNDFGKLGYGGACPPKGRSEHHYHFIVMALDCSHLDTHGKVNSYDIEAFAREHCIAEAELIGTYSR